MNKWTAGFMLAAALYTLSASTAPRAAQAAPTRWQPVDRPPVVSHQDSYHGSSWRERREHEERERRERWEREQRERRERERRERAHHDWSWRR